MKNKFIAYFLILGGLLGYNIFKIKKIGEIEKIFNKACIIKYVADFEGKDYWQTPEETKLLGTGDCEDQTFYLEDLLEKEEIDLKVVMGKLDYHDKYYHAWGELSISGSDWILDPVPCMIYKKSEVSKDRYIEKIQEDKKEYFNKKLQKYYEDLEFFRIHQQNYLE